MTSIPLGYQSGFGNEFATEARPGALPQGRNAPQVAPYGLYAEQFSGSAFTAKRHQNKRSWLYRIRPAVVHGAFSPLAMPGFVTAPVHDAVITPAQLRWGRLPEEPGGRDFIAGMRTMAVNGDALARQGSAVHIYHANESMTDRFFYNADGDMLIVPQAGRLRLRTELGCLEAEPLEIALIPRGLRFQVQLLDGTAYGYINENYGRPFELPYLGPIGANGLANPRDFQTPVASFEEKTGDFQLIAKFGGGFWQAPLRHSPLDVVAWHGNYVPYKYDLRRFNTINTVSFDHPDPSIFTVLTSPSAEEGTANVDFVIFPPRWMVARDTFRPPYFHRNVMSEFMGLLQGQYDAKPAGGFVPGGSSLHNCMSGHGPDAQAFAAASAADLRPEYLDGTMAFMFESNLVFQVTAFAMGTSARDVNYHECWQGLGAHFRANP